MHSKDNETYAFMQVNIERWLTDLAERDLQALRVLADAINRTELQRLCQDTADAIPHTLLGSVRTVPRDAILAGQGVYVSMLHILKAGERAAEMYAERQKQLQESQTTGSGS